MSATDETDVYNDIMHAAENSVTKAVSETFPDDTTDPPPEIFHYTTAEALVKIVEGGELFATHTNYLNDASEFRGALEFGAEVLSEEKTNDKLGFVALLRSYLGENVKMNPYAFVSCFCSNGDLLSQWRGYGEQGGGYAIGFDSAMLASTLDKNGYLLRCIYEEEQKKQFFKSWARSSSEFYASAREEYAPQLKSIQIKEAVVTGSYNAVAHLMPLFKSPSFREEEECRLVIFASRGAVSLPKTRVRNSLLVPYVSITLPEKSFLSLVVGPGSNQEHRVDGAEYFRSVLDGYPLRVRKSQINYRGP